MPRPIFAPRASRPGRLLPLLLLSSLAACDSAESSEPDTPAQTPSAQEPATPTKAASLLAPPPGPAPTAAVVPTLYVGGSLQTAGRPARGAELVYAVTWDGMDPTKLKWADMRTGDEGNFVIELPGNLRQFNRELQLVLRPRKPASSPFKFLRTDLPDPLPQGPVSLGTLTIERREMPEGDAQASDG